MVRKIVARDNGVALAEMLNGDNDWLSTHSDGAFDVDRDDRPMPYDVPQSNLAVTNDDGTELFGDVSWIPVLYGPSVGSMAWNVGATLVPSARGKGIGTTAWRLLARHLFETTDVFRIEASTDVTNKPTQRSLEKAGFRREGVIRSAQLRGGDLHDLVGYSMIRSDQW
jgi:hypothetical protein